MAVAFADDDATEALSRREVGRSAPTLRAASTPRRTSRSVFAGPVSSVGVEMKTLPVNRLLKKTLWWNAGLGLEEGRSGEMQPWSLD